MPGSEEVQPGPEPIVLDVSANEAIRLRRFRMREQIEESGC